MDTITAISTPHGMGGIAVIRVSGEKAIALTEQLCGQALTRPRHFISIKGLDDVVVNTYHAPHSFTGEDTTEIGCHGSVYIQQLIISRLLELGCRMARPGEFTQRAFLNGKMDLTEAEGVADLIHSESQAEHQLALSQMKGSIRSSLSILRDQLLHLTSLLTLELDFADHEELEFADRTELHTLTREIAHHLQTLLASFRQGNAIKNGISVAIVGKTNAGKSTLLNALVGEERAIVTDIHGTTRDTIEERIYIDGICYRLIDTAGLRETTDEVERLGIERSLKAIDEAEIILEVVDATQDIAEMDDERVIHIMNKSDKLGVHPEDTADTLYLSAKMGDVDRLRRCLAAKASIQPMPTMLSSMRHYEALTRALEAIERVREGLDTGLSGELICMDLKDVLDAIGEVTGEVTSDEVLHTIFSKFCIGK